MTFASFLKTILVSCGAMTLLFFFVPDFGCAESTSFSGLAFHQDGSCDTSARNQFCPSAGLCVCVVTFGSVSGLTGLGYAEVDLSEDQSSSVCFEFNASMFAVADKDVEEIDFSGNWCGESVGSIKGTYEIVRSAEGLTSVGPVVGKYSPRTNLITLHFLHEN